MEANDLLMGGGVKSASFPDQGTTVGGKIIRQPEVRQQTDFDDGTPKFFPNGDPMRQIIVQIQTDLRDPADPQDDGIRAFYLKAQMMQAVRDAVRIAGAKGLEIGGQLSIAYVRDEPNSRGRGKPKKIYTAIYQPPSAQAANSILMDSRSAAESLSSTPPAPPGVDPNTWARMAPEQQHTVLAAMNQAPPF